MKAIPFVLSLVVFIVVWAVVSLIAAAVLESLGLGYVGNAFVSVILGIIAGLILNPLIGWILES